MNKKRLLLVDDESGFTTVLKLILPQFEVHGETNSLQAIETARRFKPDMIFLDVSMPGIDGGSIAAQMREDPALCDIPIVFATGILSTTRQIGGFEFLPKPIDREQVIECVKKHLGT